MMNSLSLQRRVFSASKTFAKSGMNLRWKLKCPRMFCRYRNVVRRGRFLDDLYLGLIHLYSFLGDEMPEHNSLSNHKLGFLPTQYQSFQDAELEDLSYMSQKTIEVISKDGQIIHEDFENFAKEVGEDCRHTLLECRGGVT